MFFFWWRYANAILSQTRMNMVIYALFNHVFQNVNLYYSLMLLLKCWFTLLYVIDMCWTTLTWWEISHVKLSVNRFLGERWGEGISAFKLVEKYVNKTAFWGKQKIMWKLREKINVLIKFQFVFLLPGKGRCWGYKVKLVYFLAVASKEDLCLNKEDRWLSERDLIKVKP